VELNLAGPSLYLKPIAKLLMTVQQQYQSFAFIDDWTSLSWPFGLTVSLSIA
jgi:hypothetical protein